GLLVYKVALLPHEGAAETQPPPRGQGTFSANFPLLADEEKHCAEKHVISRQFLSSSGEQMEQAQLLCLESEEVIGPGKKKQTEALAIDNGSGMFKVACIPSLGWQLLTYGIINQKESYMGNEAQSK
ncbi:hypothetical protein U0070_007099, partial [Myodes glareolus]